MQYLIAIAIAVFLYLFQSRYYRNHWSDGLTVDISYSRSHVHIGDTVELTEQITNRKKLPLPVLYVKFKTSRTFLYDTEENAAISDYYYRNDAFSVLGNQHITRKLKFCPSQRGYFTLDSVNLVVNDLFMQKTYAGIRDNHAVLYVYPKLLKDRQSLLLTNSVIGDILTKDFYEDPLSFRGIRDYSNQDSMRVINWKATAKNGSLKVNTYFDSQNTSITLLLNLDTHTMQRMDILREYMICSTATLINSMIARGFSIRLAANAPDVLTGKPLFVETGAGNEHLQALFQGLARLDLTKEFTDISMFFEGENSVFEEKDKSTSYLLISNYRKENLLSQCLEKQQQGYSLYFICPEFSSHCSETDFYVNQSRFSGKNRHIDPKNAVLLNTYFWEVAPDEA